MTAIEELRAWNSELVQKLEETEKVLCIVLRALQNPPGGGSLLLGLDRADNQCLADYYDKRR